MDSLAVPSLVPKVCSNSYSWIVSGMSAGYKGLVSWRRTVYFYLVFFLFLLVYEELPTLYYLFLLDELLVL